MSHQLALTYDSDDHVTQVVDGTAGTTTDFAFDAAGRRTRATHEGETKQFLTAPNMGEGYDSPQAITDAAGTPLASFVFAGEMPLMKLVDGDPVYYLADAMGTVLATAGETGGLVESFDYDSFGNARGVDAVPSATHGDFRFQGMWKDPSGLYYVRARVYDAATGRFTSRDPAEGFEKIAETFLPYAFASSSPLIARDPSGLFSLTQTMVAMQASYVQLTTALAGIGGLTARVLSQTRGRLFENIVRTAIHAGRHALVAGRTLAGRSRNVVPDAIWRGVTEIKDVARLTNTGQLQAMADYARNTNQQFNLVVGPATRHISDNLIQAVTRTGGSVYYFNVASLTWTKLY